MTNYQLTVLIKDQVKEEDRKGLFEGLKKDFGNLIKEDLWGVRSLTYPIKHNDKAFYAHFEFESEPASVITLDKNIRLNEDIIRYLLIKSKKAKRIKVKKVGKEVTEIQSDKDTEVLEAADEITEVSGESAIEAKEKVVKKTIRKITKKA